MPGSVPASESVPRQQERRRLILNTKEGLSFEGGLGVLLRGALGTVWVSQRVPWFTSDPSARFLLPLLAVVATALVTGLFVSEFDYLYPLRIGVALTVLAWFRKDYLEGLRRHLRGRSIWSWQAVTIGVVAYLVWIAAWGVDSPVSNDPPAALAELSASAAMIWVAARVFGSTVTVPIVEELAFRGFLLRRLIARDFTKVPETFRWPAVLISSLAFAAAHQQWVAGFIAGLCYAFTHHAAACSPMPSSLTP